jgi:hypothetical protein
LNRRRCSGVATLPGCQSTARAAQPPSAAGPAPASRRLERRAPEQAEPAERSRHLPGCRQAGAMTPAQRGELRAQLNVLPSFEHRFEFGERDYTALLVLRHLGRAVPGGRGPVHGADVRQLPGCPQARPAELLACHDPGQPWLQWGCPLEGCGNGWCCPRTSRATRRPPIPAGSPATRSCGPCRTSWSMWCSAGSSSRRRADATCLLGRPPHPPLLPRRPGPGRHRGRRSAGPRRSRGRLHGAGR